MPMHERVGQHNFVTGSLNTLLEQLKGNTPDVKQAIADNLRSANEPADAAAVEAERQRLLASLGEVKTSADTEVPMPYVHFASRFSLVGLYQAVLSKLFADIPGLQGYGNLNPIWVVTVAEQVSYAVKSFFSHVYTDVHGGQKPLLSSFLAEWKKLKFEKAPYPAGTPATVVFPDECEVALLADWGGDNAAARRVAEQVRQANPAIAIHLGDIYYGGVKEECEAFVANWPMRVDGAKVKKDANFALNGNHEMYSGGESYFNVVLPAFAQPLPFFCLENTHWRLIGLDTAYNGGRLKPSGLEDPLTAQWGWLIDVLKNGPKKANIFLSHHQPVSAHAQEFNDSVALRQDIAELLATEGVGEDAIFGWFFGHEHRCTIYDVDERTPYMARLIGSGCIPHVAQAETGADPGCNPAKWFNKRTEGGSAGSAVSMFTELRFVRDQLVLTYIDEDSTAWGSEVWYADPGRMMATSGFVPADGVELG